MHQEFPFRIILESPPSGVDFGLQKGSGNNYGVVQKQHSRGIDLSFDFSIIVRVGKDSLPDFFGPFVQGPSGSRFIYIDIGTYAGAADSKWSGRLKVPLTKITWEMISILSADPQIALQTHVAGTGKSGAPAFATVKPFYGWLPATTH